MAKYAWRNDESDLCFDREKFSRIMATVAEEAKTISELWWLSETIVSCINSVFADRSNDIYEEIIESKEIEEDEV